LYSYENICLFYKTRLLACSMCAQAMWYMPMHIEELIACVIFLQQESLRGNNTD
jgi:hypothetical protein